MGFFLSNIFDENVLKLKKKVYLCNQQII